MPGRTSRPVAPMGGDSAAQVGGGPAVLASDSTSEVLASFQDLLHQQQSAVASQTALTLDVLRRLTDQLSVLATGSPNLRSQPTSVSGHPPLPKFSYLEDSKDAEAWFTTAEKVLTASGLDRTKFCIAVAPYLLGKALDAFNSLPASSTTDFDAVRAAVLQRFQVDAEECRHRFNKVLSWVMVSPVLSYCADWAVYSPNGWTTPRSRIC